MYLWCGRCHQWSCIIYAEHIFLIFGMYFTWPVIMSLSHDMSTIEKLLVTKWLMTYKSKKKGVVMFLTWPVPVTLLRVYQSWKTWLGPQWPRLMVSIGQSAYLNRFSSVIHVIHWLFLSLRILATLEAKTAKVSNFKIFCLILSRILLWYYFHIFWFIG